MKLKVGRYGRFYGCVEYSKTGCKGSVTAKDSGAPAGIPAKAQVRALRKQVLDGIEEEQQAFFDGDIGFSKDLSTSHPRWPKGKVGQWGLMECLAALEILDIEPDLPPARTRWERLLDDEDL